MKKLLAFLAASVCLLLTAAPALATDTASTASGGAAALPENGPEGMLIFCIIVAVAGIIYLAFRLKKP